MSDSEPTPDDLLVSAVLDGVASREEVERVAADPRLAARLAEFQAVARAVGGPVPLVDPDVRDAHLARAVAEAAATLPTPAPVAPPPPPPPVPPPVVDLAAARARRQRPRSAAILSIAAAVVLVVAAGAFLVRLGDSTGGSGDDTAASEAGSSTADAPESLAGGDQADESGEGSADAAGSESQDFSAPTTTAPTETAPGTAGSGIDAALPSLGTFAKGQDLATRVQGELVLDPTPADRVTDEACADDFGVEVALLGRATVAGEEGLVYVEAAPRTDRRLWLVDPGTVGADDACRQIVPVQTL